MRRRTHSLVGRGPDEGEELAQQHAVGGLVPAVLVGQRLQQREGAAAVAGGVVASPGGRGGGDGTMKEVKRINEWMWW